MKVVHYMSRMCLEQGGVIRAVIDLCDALAARGHEVVQMTFDPTDAPSSWKAGEEGRPRLRVIERRRLFPRLGRAAAEEVRKELVGAAAMHFHVPWDPICVQLSRIARQAGVPYIASLHGMLDDWCIEQSTWKKKLYLAMGGRRFLEGAAAVHCTAEAERDQSSKWYPNGRPAVVPLIFDLADYENLPGPELAREKLAAAFPANGEAVLLFLSRIDPKKRLELLFAAGERLRRQGVAFKLLIAGTGFPWYEQKLRRLVECEGMSGWVEFLGFVSGREKVSLYEAADVFVLPTNQENWGFVLLEALACGTPVVTTRGVDIWPELQASGGAVIVDWTEEAIASAITDLLGDPSRREQMKRSGRAWALENLNVDHVVGRYERLYEGRDHGAGR